MQAPILKTERLRLVPAGLLDIDVFHTMLTDAGVRRYLCDDRILPRGDAEVMVWNSLRSFATNGMGLWLVHNLGKDNSAIGFCLLRPPGRHAVPELLYAILPQLWGKGLTVEAARAVIDYAFGTLQCAEILAETDEPNIASARVAEKLGMERFGTRPGPVHTLLRYRIKRS